MDKYNWLDLENVDFDSLSIEERVEVEKLIKQLKLRKERYCILDYRSQEYQQQFLDAVAARNPDGSVKYKFIIFIGWNWTWKTMSCAYITMLMALGKLCKQYWLPYIGEASLIKIVTSTGAQIQENIEPYMLWTSTDKDLIKFPWYWDNPKKMWEVVTKVRREKDTLKEIGLINWSTMNFGTYDQWQARLQGGSPDFTWIDEVPTRWEDFRELIRGTRKPNAQFLMSFTPTNYNQKIYDWVYWGEDNKFVKKVNSLENKFADHSWMEGLSDEELRIVQSWDFVPPTWLVYKNFKKDDNVLPFFHPKKMGTRVKYYWALDFWTKHPMAFLFIAVDEDWHVYVFDEIYQSSMLLKDLVSEVEAKKREYWIDFEYIVADSAGKRERMELANYGMRTKKAKKKQKEWVMSNRRAGIMKINQILNLGKLVISDTCVNLINEFSTHHYAENWVDGSVKKEWDDALDALRYFIFSYTEYSEIRELKKKRKKIARKAQRSRRY